MLGELQEERVGMTYRIRARFTNTDQRSSQNTPMKIHPFRWADEAEYEWTGTSGEAGPALDLAAPRHWRLRRAATGCGAFQGLRVLLYGDFQTPSTEALKRIVLAGGGQVTAFRRQPEKRLRSVFQSSVDFVFFCFMATPGSLYWGKRESRAGR
jgi:hypothetical protein